MQQTQMPITFEGSEEERRLAEQVFGLARFQGRFFAETAPISLQRDRLVDYLARAAKSADRVALAASLDAALRKNNAIFGRSETDDGVVTYITTRTGKLPAPADEDTAHGLVDRFVDPTTILPAPERRRSTRAIEAWEAQPEPVDEPFLAAVDDVVIDRIDLPGSDSVVAEAAERAPVESELAAPEAATVAIDAPTTATATTPAALALGTLPAEAVQEALAERLARDERFVAFGDRYYSEELLDRYGRNDIRRIREYILEVSEPLSDDTLLQDLFNRRTNDPAIEGARFSLNYRLSREKREFEFVGTRDSRLWATQGLPPLGTTLRKASELGQDYRYLLDEEPAPATDVVSHVLSFFEWTYGTLPLDGAFRQLFPEPYLEEQKTAVLRFEAPQLFVNFLVELRYPTGNRGGYLVGFDEFYREYLAPGAVVTIQRTSGNDGSYTLRFAQVPEREERLLQLDERRNRYVFRSQAVACELDGDWVLSESRFPQLANTKPLDDRERRRPEVVVATAFERAAENVGAKSQPRYWSSPEELLPAVNVERPFNLRALREVLESPQYAQFSADPETAGAFFYEPAEQAPKKPAARGKRQVADEEQEELEVLPDLGDDEEDGEA